MNPKAISIVGYKDSGKTRVIEALIKELTRRGYRVGTLKHTADKIHLDTPGKDTDRHRSAGAKATGILQNQGGAFFIDKYLSLQDAVSKLGTIDYLLIEGFKTVNTHSKIIVPKTQSDIEKLSNGLEIVIVPITDLKITEANIPILHLDEIQNIANVVEEKAFPMLSGLNCHDCGYEDCHQMGIALLKGEVKVTQCINFQESFSLKVNGEQVPIGGFVVNALTGVVLGFIKTLKGGEEAESIELKFEAKKDGN
jgi:molybdopterin-guanine dinucleotide biosynthesis protein B